MYDLGLKEQPVPEGSHIVHYYETPHQGDEFARAYVETGLDAGECCVLMGDPSFIEHTIRLLRRAPTDGWPGHLFTRPVDEPPSYESVKGFLNQHVRMAPGGPSGVLPEAFVSAPRLVAPGTRFRVLGNFRHWTMSAKGSQLFLGICAALQPLYRESSGIVACQWEVAGRDAAFRWGGLFMHTHMVTAGTCIHRPAEALEKSLRSDASRLDESSVKLKLALGLGETVDAFRVAREVEAVATHLRQLLEPITIRGARGTAGKRLKRKRPTRG